MLPYMVSPTLSHLFDTVKRTLQVIIFITIARKILGEKTVFKLIIINASLTSFY